MKTEGNDGNVFWFVVSLTSEIEEGEEEEEREAPHHLQHLIWISSRVECRKISITTTFYLILTVVLPLWEGV